MMPDETSLGALEELFGKNEIANAWDLTPAYLYVKFTTEVPPSAFRN